MPGLTLGVTGLVLGVNGFLPLGPDELLLHGGVTVVKATLLMAGALGLSLLLRRSSAAYRHALWTGTIVALLALPFLPALTGPLPGIPVPVLPAVGDSAEAVVDDWGALGDPSSLGDSAEAMTARVGPVRGSARSDSAEAPGHWLAGGAGELGSDAPGVDTAGGGVLSVGPPGTDRPATGLPANSFSAAEHPDAGGPGIAPWLLAAWALGVLAFLLPLALGIFRGRGLIGRAIPVARPEWTAALGRAAARVGLQRRVSMRLTPEAPTAMVGGVLRPVVLLPEAALRWGPERRDLVLLHELVHVKRHDPARQILGRLAVALYWFHPLAWWVAREASMAREEACDERVVALGQRPSVYAGHLLDLTRTDAPALAGLTGFHHPDLEKRLMKILDPEPRSGRWAGLATGALAVVWVVTVAALSAVDQEVPSAMEASLPAEASSAIATPAPAATPVSAGTPLPAEVAEPLPGPALADTVRPASPPLPAPAEPTPKAPEVPPAPAGPTPEAPEAPPTPPHPLPQAQCPVDGPPGDEFRGVRTGSDTLARSVVTRIEGMTLCLHSRGEIEWDPEGARIRSMAPGASVTLSATGEEGTQWLRITPGEADGELHHRWVVGGEERPAGPEVMEWRDAHLAFMAAYGSQARLRGQIARVRGETARLHGEVARIQGEEARLRGERARALSQEPRLQAEIARMQAEGARIASEIARLRSAEPRLQAERARLARQLAVMEEAREAVTDPDVRAGLSSEIAALREKIERVEAEVREAEVSEEVAVLQDRLAEHRSRMEERIAEVRAEIEALAAEDDPEAVDEEIARHRAETRERMEALRARIAEQEEEARERIGEVQAEMEALHARMGDLGARLLDAIEAAGFDNGNR